MSGRGERHSVRRCGQCRAVMCVVRPCAAHVQPIKKAPPLLPSFPRIPAPFKRRHNLHTLQIEAVIPSWRHGRQRTARITWGIRTQQPALHILSIILPTFVSLAGGFGDAEDACNRHAGTDARTEVEIDSFDRCIGSIDRFIDRLGRALANVSTHLFRSIEAPKA